MQCDDDDGCAITRGPPRRLPIDQRQMCGTTHADGHGSCGLPSNGPRIQRAVTTARRPHAWPRQPQRRHASAVNSAFDEGARRVDDRQQDDRDSQSNAGLRPGRIESVGCRDRLGGSVGEADLEDADDDAVDQFACGRAAQRAQPEMASGGEDVQPMEGPDVRRLAEGIADSSATACAGGTAST